MGGQGKLKRWLVTVERTDVYGSTKEIVAHSRTEAMEQAAHVSPDTEPSHWQFLRVKYTKDKAIAAEEMTDEPMDPMPQRTHVINWFGEKEHDRE